MKKSFYILLFFVSIIYSQNSDKGEVTYLDYNQNTISKENASYYEFKTPYKDEIFKYQKYYIFNTTKAYLIEKYYFDKENKKQGKYNSYYKDGIIKTEGIYKDGLKIGPWKKYDKVYFKSMDSIDNSTYLQSLKYYKNDKRNGSFKDFYEDGSLQGEGQYKDDNFIGECKWYHPNGQMSSLEIYNDKGKLKDIQQWNKDGIKNKNKQKSNHDLKESKKDLHFKISKELNNKMNYNIYKMYPNQYGKVYVQINFDKNGKIHVINTKSTYGISLGYKKEIKRVLNNMSKQKPIYYHNQLTDIRFTIPIKIFPRPSNR